MTCAICQRPVTGLYRRRLKDNTPVCVVCVEYNVLPRAVGAERQRALRAYSLVERA